MPKVQDDIPNDGDRINMLGREVASGFERIEKVLIRFDERLTQQDQAIGRVGKPNMGFWAIVATIMVAVGGGVLTLCLAGIGAAYTLQSKENERFYSEFAHTRDEIAHGQERYERKMEKLDFNDAESSRDRTSTKEALREIETQFRLGREIQDRNDQIEAISRDLAIERAVEKLRHPNDATPAEPSKKVSALEFQVRSLTSEVSRLTYENKER
jgi:hypothetical protein